MTIGERIRELRKERGIGGRELSKMLNHGREYVSQVEGGHRNIDLIDKGKIADIFGITFQDLVRGTAIYPNDEMDSLPADFVDP